MRNWSLWLTFRVSLRMILGILAQFPQLCDLGTWIQFPQIASIPKYLWNRYSSTNRVQWHYCKVSFDVKQGAEDFGLPFRCSSTWFGVFRPSFSKLPQYSSTCETRIARPTEGNDTRVRSYLMWKKELKTLDYFSCDSLHDVGVFGPFFPKLP